jgi:hypothetical protein
MKSKKIALLWAEPSLGLYGNRSFDALYKGFGHNSGNLAFVYAISHQLTGSISYVPWSTPKERLATYDVVVVPCANQLGKHTELGSLGDLWGSYDKPIVAIGLGAQAKSFEDDIEVTPGTLSWAKMLAAKAPGSASNIWTRGPYTTRQLDRLGIPNAVVGGCPTHFIHSATDLGRRIARAWKANPVPRAVTVAAGHQSWAEVRTIEQQLIGLMQDIVHDGQYVTQSAGDMVRISRNEFHDMDPDVLKRVRNHVAPHLSEDEFKSWCRRYARTYYDIPAWMESLRRHDLTIGPRYHGTAIALQAERMGVTVTIDSRTEEMCSQTGVPFLRAKDLADKAITRATLKKLIQFDPTAYDALRAERAGAYIAFLEANGLQPKDYLKKIADGPVRSAPKPAAADAPAAGDAPAPVAAAEQAA